MGSATSVFRGQMLSTNAGDAGVATSPSMEPLGNRAVLAVTVINTAGSASGVFRLQGSYDGSLWRNIGTAVSQNTFGYKASSTAEVIDHAFVRVCAEAKGTDVSLLFDAAIAWSQQ